MEISSFDPFARSALYEQVYRRTNAMRIHLVIGCPWTYAVHGEPSTFAKL